MSAGTGRGRLVQLSLDAILDPVGVPPFDRVDRMAIDQHGEVQVIAASKSGHPAAPDRLAFFHRIANLDIERPEMAVEGLNAHAVVENNAVAVDAKPTG